jgi:hypothetical protein
MIILVLALFALVSITAASQGEQISASGIYTGKTGPTYWRVNIITADPSALVLTTTGQHPSWCSDLVGHLTSPFGPKQFSVYSTLYSMSSFPPGSKAATIGATGWQKINWIINQPSTIDYRIKQAGIWKLDGASLQTYPHDGDICPDINVVPASQGGCQFGYNTGDYDTFMGSIDTSFSPGIGDKVAIVLYSTDAQEIFVEETRTGNTAPEFPTLALPVGMLIGVIGLVYITKKREI